MNSDIILNKEIADCEQVTTMNKQGYLGLGYLKNQEIYVPTKYGIAVNAAEIEFPVVDYVRDGGHGYFNTNNKNSEN